MKRTDPRIVVTGYLKVVAEDRDAFVKLLQPHVQRTRQKEGCIAYAFASDIPDPSIIRMSEAWRDLKSLETHLADDEFQAVLTETSKFRIVERNVQRYEVSSTTDI
jgi:quinol monooxygenase YgiN